MLKYFCETIWFSISREVIECTSDINKVYRCEHCGKEYLSWTQLKTHFRSHETATKRQIAKALEEYKCEMCGKLCGDKGVLHRHIEEFHFKKTRFECNNCGKSFYYKYMLARHIRENHSTTPPTCELCHTEFARFSTLRKHQMVKHNPEYQKLYCDICSINFTGNNSFKRHMKKKHSNDPGTIICSVCGKILCSISSLKDHMQRLHNDETPFACDKCDKAFTTALSLKTHKLTHEGPTFHCDLCDKCFIQPASLRIHIKRIHIGDKPYPCDICSKNFATRTELKKHRVRCKGPKTVNI